MLLLKMRSIPLKMYFIAAVGGENKLHAGNKSTINREFSQNKITSLYGKYKLWIRVIKMFKSML